MSLMSLMSLMSAAEFRVPRPAARHRGSRGEGEVALDAAQRANLDIRVSGHRSAAKIRRSPQRRNRFTTLAGATVLVTSGAVLWQHARMMVAAPAL